MKCESATNKEFSPRAPLVLLLSLALTLAVGCGGGGDPVDEPPSISISPTAGTADPGGTVALAVTARNTEVAWPSPGEVAGSYTRTGNTAAWTLPETPGVYEFTVRASSGGKSATARIEVVPPEPEISIPLGRVTIDRGASVRFEAVVETPEGQPGQTAAWEVVGSCGTIAQDGLFTATEAGSCAVRATVDGRAGKIAATAEVTVREAPAYEAVEYPTARHTYATGIDGSGRVAGTYTGADGRSHGFVKEAGAGGRYATADCPGATDTYVEGASGSGVLAGSYRDASGATHGFVREGGVCEPVDHPDADETHVWASNDAGMVAGHFKERGTGLYRGFLKDGEAYTTFDYPDAAGTYPMDVNGSGTVVGYFKDAAAWYHGFVREAGGHAAVDYPMAGATEVHGINGAGAMAGYFTDAAGRTSSFVYADGEYEVFAYPGAAETCATGISDAGRVTGYYIDGAGKYHGFVR